MSKLPFHCPHCDTSVLLEPEKQEVETKVANEATYHVWTCTVASCPACHNPIVWLSGYNRRYTGDDTHRDYIGVHPFVAYPRDGQRPVPTEVPTNIAMDFEQASVVLDLSPKASAALSRRCLQNMLSMQGYEGKNLAKQIDAVLSEADPRKSLPTGLLDTVDAIRNFGNFSAHPINDVTSLQVLDVEPEEAEWCLEILERLFDHYYVMPAYAKAKKAALDAKLKKANKPPAK